MRIDCLLNAAVSSACWLILLTPVTASSAEDRPLGTLELVSTATRPSLGSVTSVVVSGDGNYLYTAAFNPGAVNVFQRDPRSGALDHLQEISGAAHLNGAVGLRISPDGKYAAVAAFRGKSVSLYRIGPDGLLTGLDAVTEGDPINPANPQEVVRGLGFAIDLTFSADSQFIHVSNASRSDGMTTFRINDGRLVFVEHNTGIDNCFDDTRGPIAHPDGRTIIIVSSRASSVVSAHMDPATGRLGLRDLVVDDNDVVPYINGAMGVGLSPRGKHVYVSSGRFRGDNAVTVFEFDPDSQRLDIVQSLSADEGDFQDFVGGNEIVCSPDGLNVYAAATLSGSVAMFGRDPASGRLTYIGTVADREATNGAAGICVSPDGNFVYVAAEKSATVSVFRRNAKLTDPDETSRDAAATEDATKDSVGSED